MLGASLTTILSHNIILLIEMSIGSCAACCARAASKGGLNITPATTAAQRAANARVSALRHAILFASYISTGIYYGYIYGTVAATEIGKANPQARYDPWPPVFAYLEYTITVAAGVGFFSAVITAVLGAGGGAPAPPPAAGAAAPGRGGVGGGAGVGNAPPVQGVYARRPLAGEGQLL